MRWCGLFGIAEGTARVALHRMAAKGEIAGHDGVYRLAGGLVRRQDRQESSLRPARPAVDGGVADGGRRRDPARGRPRRPARPRCAGSTSPSAVKGSGCAPTTSSSRSPRRSRDQCEWLTARPDDDPVALAARLFHPQRWAWRAEALRAHLAETTDRLAGDEPEVVADAFVAGAAALRHIGGDPLLPPTLLPADWPGERLRAEYARYQRAFDATARAWFRAAARA